MEDFLTSFFVAPFTGLATGIASATSPLDVIDAVDGFVWGPIMILLLLFTHIFMTVRTGFIQRKLGTGIKMSVTKDDPSDASGDITQFGAQFASTPLDMMWNIAIFLPLGMVLQALIKSMWKTAIGAAVLALIVEGAQYIFSVGIFDILDIVLNVGGIMLGALIISSAMLDGWHFGMDRHFLTLTK